MEMIDNDVVKSRRQILGMIFMTQGPEITYGKIYEVYIGEDCALSKHAHLIHTSFSNFQVNLQMPKMQIFKC